MTEEEYWNAVRRLGLYPSDVPFVFRDYAGDVYNVPDPSRYAFDERPVLIAKLKGRLGIV